MKFYRDGLELDIDAPPMVSVTREGHIVEAYTVDGKAGFFVTLAGLPYCAHGETLSQAIADATWKDESKRPSLDALKSEIQAAGRSRKISLSEFRTLTGACAEGCRVALKRANLDGSPMTAGEIKKYFPDWGQRLCEVLEWT